MNRLPVLVLVLLFLAACPSQTVPAAAREHQARGDKSLAAGDAEAALVAYAHARELAPADPALQEATMRAQAYLYAEDPVRITSVAEARYSIQVLLEAKKLPESVGKTALANLAFREGDSAAAEKLLGEAVVADGKDRLPHRALGMMLATRKDDAVRARGELEAALALQAGDPPVVRSLAQLLLSEGEVSAAVTVLEKGLAGKEDAPTRLLLCQLREQGKDPAPALACYRELTQRAPLLAEGWGTLGQMLLQANELVPAEKALRRSLELRPEPGVQVALGFTLNRQNKGREALPVFQEVLARDPAAPLALFGAGQAAEATAQPELARVLYQRLLAVPPGDDLVTNLQSEAQNRLRGLQAPARPPAR